MSLIHPKHSTLTKSIEGNVQGFDENGKAESGTWEIIELNDFLSGGYFDLERCVHIHVKLKEFEVGEKRGQGDDDDDDDDDDDEFEISEGSDDDDDLEEDLRAFEQHKSLKRKLDHASENKDDDENDGDFEDDNVDDETYKMSGYGNIECDDDFIVDDIENEDEDYLQPRVYTPCVDNGVNLSGLTNQGATCYLNSFLQVVYHTPHMRYAIFQFEPGDAMSKAIQSVFFRMLRT